MILHVIQKESKQSANTNTHTQKHTKETQRDRAEQSRGERGTEYNGKVCLAKLCTKLR